MTELRDAFFYHVLDEARKDKNVILLTGDMGAFALKDCMRELPNQFFNVGIAEQNMVSVASGLSLAGKKVYVYTIASFLVMRAFEQIKIDVCNMKTNVILVGVSAGVDYSYDGSTHHCPNDIGVLRTLPNMKVFAPFDEYTIKTIVNEESGPMYIRLPKGVVENVPKMQIAPGYYHVRAGKSYVVTYGMMVHKILKMFDELNVRDVGLVALTKVHPPYEIRSTWPLLGKKFIVVESHNINGGLLSALGEGLMMEHIYSRWNGYQNTFVDVGGTLEYVEGLAGLDYKRVAKQIKELDNDTRYR